jgi:hypothetical protein
LQAQVVYTPLHSDVYDFLERQSLNHIVQLDDEVKPYSRKYISDLLIEIEKYKSELSDLERDELEFYKKEYAYELKDYLNERWFLFSHSDSLFSLKFSPIAGYGLSSVGTASGHTQWIGLSVFGTYSDWFGGSFDIRDKGEFGDNVDKEKQYSSLTGAWYKKTEDGIEYSDIKGSINFNWDWGSVGLIKDYFTWGHGSFGQIIFSEKAPSYPHIRLNLKPAEWFRFNYFHGWLNSLVIDSSTIHYEHTESLQPRKKEEYINKYVAANMLTVTPWQGVDLSLGNSFVYSGDLRPEMFIPFMFFKLLDHNTGRGNVDDGNGAFYFDVSVKYPEEFQFYSTVFVDVTEIRNVLDNNFTNTWVGYTFGAKKVNLFFNYLDISAEYTRINPWVYEHKYESTTMKHIDYQLGHWIGQNADQIKIQFDYRLLRGLKFTLYFERYRKGGMDDIYYAYSGIDEFDKNFLYSPLRVDKYVGLNIRYEYLHDLILEGAYKYSDITDESVERTEQFLLGKKNSFLIALYYGL